MTPPLPFAEVTLSETERDAFLERVRPGVSAEDYRLIEGMSHALPELLDLIAQDAPITRAAGATCRASHACRSNTAERALRRAANNVRAQSRALKLPLVVWENGKVVEKPA